MSLSLVVVDSKAVESAAKLAVLLAVSALFAAARADQHEHDDHHWKCYSSCMHKCYHHQHDAVDSTKGGVRYDDDHKCKECVEDCFEDVPAAVCYHTCVADPCISLPPSSAARVACFKRCGLKCFHHDSPKPKPGPPKPGPKPTPPKPGPKPCPPKPAKPVPRPPCPPKAPVTSSNSSGSSNNN